MKTDRRTSTCLNCNKQLSEEYKYCPNCGQKNSDNNVSVGTLLGDVFSNYFSLDSKFIKSFIPFFFKPGVLTKRFVEGKRVRFIQPVRLYVFTSLIFFFVLTTIFSRIDFSFPNVFNGDENDEDSIAVHKSDNTLSQQILDSMTVKIDSLNRAQVQTDTLASFLNDVTWDGFLGLLQDQSISNEALFDSLNFTIEGRLANQFTSRVREISRSGTSGFVPFLLKNLPVMMVFVVPILALILKLLYIRRKKLYITHLVHAIHLHAFTYFTYGLLLLMIYFSSRVLDDLGYFMLAAIGVVGAYSLLSFLTVYKQGVFKTLLKFIAVGFFYSFIMLLFLMGESYLSFLYF